jgi:hypothetical protein
MNIEVFESIREHNGVRGTGFDTVTTKERMWTSKTTGNVSFTIPAGVKVHVWFMPLSHPERMYVQYGNEVKLSHTQTAGSWLNGFTKTPTIRTLKKRSCMVSAKA